LVPNWVSKPSAVLPKGAGHDAGVGDHQVEGPAIGDQGVGAGANAGQVGEVELDELQAAAVGRLGADLGGRGLGLLQVAGGADHLGAVGGQGAGGLDAQAGGDAGHQDALAAEVDAGEDFVGGGGGAKGSGHGEVSCLGEYWVGHRAFLGRLGRLCGPRKRL
jgi:hypothetical protein